MIFSQSGRKKPRPGAGPLREAAEPGSTSLLRKPAELVILAVSFLVLVGAVTRPPEFFQKAIGYNIASQTVALEEVRADIFFETEDLHATKQKREEAAAKVPDTYRVDRERVEQQLGRLDERIQALRAKGEDVAKALRNALKKSKSSQTESEVISESIANYAETLKKERGFEGYPSPSALAVWLMPTLDSAPQRRFVAPATGNGHTPLAVAELAEPETTPLKFAYADDLTRLSREALEYVLTYGVSGSGKPEEASKSIVIIRQNPVADLKVSAELPLKEVPKLKDAEGLLSERMVELARPLAGKDPARPVDWARLQAAALEMTKPCLTDTLFLDQVYTEGAREQARKAVAPVLKEIQPGEVIQRSGDKWTAQSRSDVQTYWAKLQAAREPVSLRLAALSAMAIFVVLTLGCLIRSILVLTPRPQDTVRNVNLSLLLMVAMVILGRVVSYFEPSGFVLPTAAGAILLAILVNPRIAVMMGFMTSALVSVQFGYDWRLLIVSCAMCIAGVFGIYVVRRRSDMTAAALKATAVGIVTMLAVTLATDSLASGPALRRILLVLLNGCACVLIVPGVLSPLERLFRITTDIQLLEYTDLNNELLSRLAIEIPATYAHSLMLGQVAEAAAEAIGANGLLARVCAYYHDIGKLHRPEYFSENQTGVNIHDALPPRVSARAVAAHATYGVELAREYHLPKPILDGILEHHGTCLIGFFYQQAVEQHRHHDVQQEDFRYPGPRPQSRETAILMICDAVESGVRSIKNPNEERVREFVDKIIANRSSDRQFDECSLTLKDLDTIRDVVTRRVVTALHTRIAYPEKKVDKKVDNVIPISGGAK